MGIWIGLGSNIGDGPGKIGEALYRIETLDGVRVIRHSGLYRSDPLGYEDQDVFTNAVAELDSRLEPLELLMSLNDIEFSMGRRRGSRRWGPRDMDLDILLVSDLILVLDGLTVPHPRMHQRAFVLLPLSELQPDLVIPGRGTVRACLARVSGHRVSRLDRGKTSDG
jgi:2-amino-4-hydroxy-6-hydroxymethyldihydropteridine diphosphokinase